MHSFRSKTHISVISHRFDALKSPFGFAPHTLRLKLLFRVASRHSLLHLTHCENQYRVHQMHEFMPPKPFLVLSQRTCPIHYFSLKLIFWVFPCHFVARHVAKTSIEAHLMHEFVPLEPFRPIHYFRSKIHVLDGFPPFDAAPDPLRKFASGHI